MYSSIGTKRDVMLWCDGAKQDSPDVGNKRPSPSINPPSKRTQIEEKVDELQSMPLKMPLQQTQLKPLQQTLQIPDLQVDTRLEKPLS